MRFESILRRNKQLLESLVSLSLLKALSVLFPLITLPYIFRVVGAANYGIYSFVYVVIQYILIINAYGFNYTATKQIAQCRNDKCLINEIFNSVIYCRLLILSVELIFFSLISFLLFDSKESFYLFFGGVGIILGDILNPVWLFQGMEKMRYMTIVHFSLKILFLTLIFIFIRKESDYIYLTLIDSIGHVLAGMISIYIAYKEFNVKLSKPNYCGIVTQLKEGAILFWSNMSINLYKNANIFVLKFFVTDDLLGVYSAAEKVVKGLQLMGSPISQALFPHYGKKFKEHSVKQNIGQLYKSARYFALLLTLISIIGMICSSFIIKVICGKDFLDAVPILRIMIPVVIFGGLNSLLGLGGLINLEQKKYFFQGVIIAGGVNLILLLSLANNWGIYAGAFAFLLSEIVLFILIIYRLLIMYRHCVIYQNEK